MAPCFQIHAPLRFLTRRADGRHCPRVQPVLTTQQHKATTMPVGALQRPSVIFVTPNGICKDLEHAKILVQQALKGGASLIQVRDRRASKYDMINLVQALLNENIPPTSLTINGLRPREVMRLSSNLGVHIRQNDIEEFLAEAQTLAPTPAVIGCSVHSTSSAEAAVAISAPNYFQIGTMFATSSHPGKEPEGPGLLRDIRAIVGPSQHLVGVGGICADNLIEVFTSSADGIAVISAISSANDPTAATSELVSLCKNACERQ